jgi:hypothetical protein
MSREIVMREQLLCGNRGFYELKCPISGMDVPLGVFNY